MGKLTASQKLAIFKKSVIQSLISESIVPFKTQERVKRIDKNQKIPDDFFGLRLIFKNKKDCYQAKKKLQQSLNIWKIKDFYFNHHPKEPTYRAIHLLVKMGHQSHFEIQIKTVKIHQLQTLKRQLLGSHYWQFLTIREIVEFDKKLRSSFKSAAIPRENKNYCA